MTLRELLAIGRGLGDLLYPPVCLVCDASAPGPLGHGLCNACRPAVTVDAKECCPRCATTTGPHADVSGGCPDCRGKSLGFDRAVRMGEYDGRLRDAVLKMKNAAGEPLAELLGQALGERLKGAKELVGIDLVVPVPLHWLRRWGRGYNQAESIAREAAGVLGMEFRAGWLRRGRGAAQHAQLSSEARRRNVRGVFRTPRCASFGSRGVLLVDDVMTTGSTAGEAARVLRAAGAREVVAAVLARA